MTGRSVPEWRGKSPDSPVPPHVKARIFERWAGRCHISGRKIGAGEPWQVEHIKPLCMGGEHAEFNLAPALVDAHKRKTAREAGERAKADRIKMKHLGLHKPRSRLSHPTLRKTMDGRVVRKEER